MTDICGEMTRENPSPRKLSIRDFNYELPDERIARYPLPERDRSKLLVWKDGSATERVFRELPALLEADDLLVFNDTRVIRARLLFRKPTGSVIEILCLEPNDLTDPALSFARHGGCEWVAMVGNKKRWKEPFQEMKLEGTHGTFILKARLAGKKGDAEIIAFEWDERYSFSEVIEWAGKIPLPPYLDREAEEEDTVRYQTVYARQDGSVAAPTAGLHFTPEVFDALHAKGIQTGFVTLHVGAGTFRPVKAEHMKDHVMHEERIFVNRKLIEQLLHVTGRHRVIPVGTTSLRTVESLYWFGRKLKLKGDAGIKELNITQWEPYESTSGPDVSAAESLQAILEWMKTTNMLQFTGVTQLMIAPGYEFRLADALVTNFHQPGSTLLLLVAALVGSDWKKMYDYALKHDFRFLSYGDSSILFR